MSLNFKLCAALILLPMSGMAATAECPKDALGVERIIDMSAFKGEAFGAVQHKALPLKAGEVVLTFDDGPRPETTPVIVEALRAQCTKATFFMVGQNIERNADVALKVLADGHAIGLHSYKHQNMSELTPEEQVADFTQTKDAAHLVFKGAEIPAYRFPFLAEAPTLMEHLKAQGYNVMSIDLSIMDWAEGETPETVEARLFKELEAKTSGIILMHDAQDVTAAAMPHMLASLKAKGYKVVHLKWKPVGQ